MMKAIKKGTTIYHFDHNYNLKITRVKEVNGDRFTVYGLSSEYSCETLNRIRGWDVTSVFTEMKKFRACRERILSVRKIKEAMSSSEFILSMRPDDIDTIVKIIDRTVW
jgi:hypothetical protein